jgi:hypothetical protein
MIPGGTVGIASPRQMLDFVLDYLAKADSERLRNGAQKFMPCWRTPPPGKSGGMYGSVESIALSPDAVALRAATEDLSGTEFAGKSASFAIAGALTQTTFLIGNGDGIWSGQFTGNQGEVDGSAGNLEDAEGPVRRASLLVGFFPGFATPYAPPAGRRSAAEVLQSASEPLCLRRGVRRR